MKRIGVIINQEKDTNLEYSKILIDNIIRLGARALVQSQDFLDLNPGCEVFEGETIFDVSELVMCLGGDGTFLRVARKTFRKNIPILGINLGSLGFLTEIDRNDIEKVVSLILEGKYTIEKRMMLETNIKRAGTIISNGHALNDVVVSRGALSRIIHLKMYIDDEFYDSFPSDGLMVSSPTGSTAYSLSCGGPIVEPDIDLLIVTPICPHILYSRSFIANGNRVVKVVVDENYSHDAMVTVDGQDGFSIKGGDVIEVKKASHSVEIIRVNSLNFFNILRTKIYDRGERFRKDEI